MKMKYLSVVAVCALTACLARAGDDLVRYEASHDAMGTVFSVVAYGRDRDDLAEVVDEVFEEIDRLDAQMSNYKPASELSVINREAAARPVLVEPKLFELIRESLGTSRETGGAFDITVGPLMKSWGFFRGQGRLPSPAEVARVLKRIGYRHVRLDGGRRTIAFDEPGIEIDLGGIAKGYAVDRAVQILRENGVRSALVSSGTSSIYALGAPPGARGWEVNVRDPYDAHQAADVVLLRNSSLSISGNYEKFFRVGGKTYCHIMNPRTGWPVERMLSTVALSRSATETDALSTSFFVMGVERSRKYLATHPGLKVIFYAPAESSTTFRRVVLESPSSQPESDALAEIETRR